MLRTLSILVLTVALSYFGINYVLTMPQSSDSERYSEIRFTAPLDFGSAGPEYNGRSGLAKQFSFDHPLTKGNKALAHRTWYGVGPTSSGPHPTLVLLHGAGRNGASMIDMWHDFAAENQIVLIAPNSLASTWDFFEDGEAFLGAVLEDAKEEFQIDPDQIYLFGHSAGADIAHLMANRTNGPWVAAGSHGGAINPVNVKQKSNAIPIVGYIGTRDRAFPLRSVKRSMRLLADAGHNVDLYIIPKHSHWYYDIGPQIAEHVWQALTSASMGTVPTQK